MLENFTLLYVEDDKETVQTVSEIISLKVKELFIAYDGEEGLESYKNNKPDIVLTDIAMPRLNGIDMAKAIKKIDDKQSIVIFTAFSDNKLLHECVDIGVDGYVTKPLRGLDKLLLPLEKVAQRLQSNIDQKNLEHLLEVQGKTAAVGEMISNIAHQWRQPLAMISMAVNNIKLSIDLKEEITVDELTQCSDGILQQTQYLSKTIDDFREFLKADTSNKNEFDLKDVTEESCKLVEASLKDHDIELFCDMESCKIVGNQNQFVQVLINILNNAKDAIVLNEMEDKLIFIKLSTKKENIVLSIKDSGGGIVESMKDKLFEPYTTSKHPSVGTGIGLYISFKLLTQSYNSTIEANNVEYKHNGKNIKGAEFVIKIPKINKKI